VLGSGGHTAEMLSMLRTLDPRRYHFRTYIISSGDAFSALKAAEFEKSLEEKYTTKYATANKDRVDSDSEKTYEIITVPRARRIHQPLYTTPYTSLLCLFACLRAVLGLDRRPVLLPSAASSISKPTKLTTPDLVLTNGPATGVIVVLAVQLIRLFGLGSAALYGTGFKGEEGEMRCIYVESWARVKTLSLSGRILGVLGATERFFVQWEKGRGGRREWRGFLVA
jgi:beta-1,4-N-acetylglucosaminyltransferase